VKFSLQAVATVLFVVWLILLAPWLIFAALSGMAFDADSTVRAYIFVSSVWTYPLAVVIVAIFRKRKPLVALLPFLNIAALFSDLLWKSN
jgi:hypothetical protein